jgi:hypothetical protein
MQLASDTRHSSLFALRSGQSGLGIYTTRRDTALKLPDALDAQMAEHGRVAHTGPWAVDQFGRLGCRAGSVCAPGSDHSRQHPDAALIRLAEISDAPLLLTTDSDFPIYCRFTASMAARAFP